MALSHLERRGRRALWAALVCVFFAMCGLQAVGNIYLSLTGHSQNVAGIVCGPSHRWGYVLQADGTSELSCAKVEDNSD